MRYIMQRFQSKKASQAYNQILHNLRLTTLDYLRNDLKHNKLNNVLIINDGDNYTKKDITIKNNKQIFKEIKKINDDENERLLSFKNYRKKRNASIIDSIIAPSNSIIELTKDGDFDKQKVEELFLKTIQENCKQLGLEMMYATVHYDETTPHCHVVYKNYDDNGKAKSLKLKKDYAKSQDIAGDIWKEVGFNRGEVKEVKVKHNDLRKSHNMEIESLIKSKQDIKNEILAYIEKEQEIHNTIDIIKVITNPDKLNEEVFKQMLQKTTYKGLWFYSLDINPKLFEYAKDKNFYGTQYDEYMLNLSKDLNIKWVIQPRHKVTQVTNTLKTETSNTFRSSFER